MTPETKALRMMRQNTVPPADRPAYGERSRKIRATQAHSLGQLLVVAFLMGLFLALTLPGVFVFVSAFFMGGW